MHLGSVIALTRPLLLQTTFAYIGATSDPRNLKFGLKEFSQSGHFLYEAALTSVLGIVYRKLQNNLDRRDISETHLNRQKAALAAAMKVLEHCAPMNKTAYKYSSTLHRFRDSFSDLLG
ncbi:uncharacterized protein KY384_008075 [Bacidia gigantensis]|uniref:uncharacterized protein n=1 Tax=Bacidia gigantensis TaxID=2732470 RepID=UPI001D03FF70|nr:uncharacterized protein KY384_008075 [Bacidia gigantensis]KAG8526646.1 hypothetical protein KY384_008075 [Bacidia gigantensis]